MNSCRPRSPEAVAEAVAVVDPEHNPEYQRRDLDGDGHPETFCNWLVSDITALLDCPIPRTRANNQVEWLREERGGWRGTTPAGAMERAKGGFPTVVGYWNPNARTGDDGEPVLEGGRQLHRPGHIALVRVPPAGEAGVWIAQAGASNFALGKLIQGFGHHAPLEFFTHD